MERIKLKRKFSIVTAVMAALALFGWYAIYFLNANVVLDEFDQPLSSGDILILTAAISVVSLSWTVSAVVMVIFAFKGYGCYIDHEGIHNTICYKAFLAFVFVIPVKTIPFSAIIEITKDDGGLQLDLDKSKITAPRFIKPFISKYHYMLSGYLDSTSDEMLNAINKYSGKGF